MGKLSRMRLNMSKHLCSRNSASWLWGVLLFSGVVRLLSLGAYPLFDNTESRYAEIARKMAMNNNWITPQFDNNLAFWGKPPLSIWATALSLKVFGSNEFAARFSSFLFALGIVWLVYRLAMKRQNKDYAVTTAVILSTTVLFFVAGGSVMTDPALAFGTTLSMTAFWLAMHGEGSTHRFWGYLFFVGLAIGLLAKGPIAIVLTAIPIILWIFGKKQWASFWQRLPWLGGSLLTIAIALPWYWAAERATPGYLEYFIIGEHWKRFTESGWKGDLYGTGHSHLRGTIWLYWFLATFPWGFAFIGIMLRGGRRAVGLLRDDWLTYLVLWAAAPMLFFTLAGNILWTYVLPGIPAFALLLAELLKSAKNSSPPAKFRWSPFPIALVTPVVFTLLLLFFPSVLVLGKTQKDEVASYLTVSPEPTSKLIYFGDRPYSAEFYSRGIAQVAMDQQMLEQFLDEDQKNYFLIKKIDHAHLSTQITTKLVKINDFGQYQLFASVK